MSRKRLPPPLISIVIPLYNRSDLIRPAICSCLEQAFSSFEVIVVDDGSSDDLAAALSPFADDDRVRLVRHERNQGVSAARNTGVGAAKGDLVAFLDSDDSWRPDKLEKQVAHIDARPDGRFICGTLTEVRSETAVTRVRPKRRKPKGVALGDYLFVDKVQRGLPLVDHDGASLMGGCFAQTSSLLLPRSLALETPFRTALNQYEDLAFLVDLDRRGVDFLLVEELLTIQNNDDRPGRLGARDDIERGRRFLDELGEALSPDARLAFEATHLAHLYGRERPLRVIGLALDAMRRGVIAPKSVLGILSRSLLGQAGQKAMRDRMTARRWRSQDREAA